MKGGDNISDEESKRIEFEREAEYVFDNRVFIVEATYKDDGESVNQKLLRLMKNDVDTASTS